MELNKNFIENGPPSEEVQVLMLIDVGASDYFWAVGCWDKTAGWYCTERGPYRVVEWYELPVREKVGFKGQMRLKDV